MKKHTSWSKTFSIAFFSLLAVLACGPLEFLFTNIPQRYIEPNVVNNTDLIGDWEITPESASQVDILGKSQHGVSTPWNSFSLYEDGTCRVQILSNWLSFEQNLLLNEDAQNSCAWKLELILGYAVDGTFKKVPGIRMVFEHYVSLQDSYELYFGELFIVHENDELILWNFIGNSDFSNYQDYRKTKP